MRKQVVLLVAVSVLLGTGVVYGFSPNTDTSLVGWWKLDETSGTTAADSSGKGNNGTLMNGPTWAAGTKDGALQFDGVDDYVDCGNIPIFNLTSQVTVAVWVYNGAPTVAQQVWVWKGNTGYGLKETWTGGAASFCVQNAGTWYEAAATPLLTASDTNTWIHWTGTYDGATARVYRNGVSAGSIANTSGIASTTDPVSFGRGGGDQKFFNGRLDDVRIYSRALTADEIVAVVNVINTPVGPASNPNPKDKVTDVSRATLLSWTPGPFAGTHNVYFGTDFNDVNNASTGSPLLVSKGQDANTYDPPGVLQFGQIYYWRVDEVNAPPTSSTIFKGTTWSFTTEPVAYPVTGITATASSTASGYSAQFTVDGSGLTGDLATTDSTTTEWLSTVTPTAPVWIEYDLGALYKLSEMWVWNSNYQFEWALNFGLKSVTIQYSADGTTWTKLGDYQFAQAPSAAGYAHSNTVNFTGVAAKKVRITANSNYGGKQYGLSEVRFYSIPVAAREPNPAIGATGIAPDVTLSWRAGREAASHQVYLGTDPNNLTLAGTSATNSFAPANLSLGTKYYWRVDEVNTAQAISTWAGPVWNFATNPFIVVDDMESYNDSTNQIFNVWVDGYGTTTNGAVVGLATSVNGTFGSTTIFHSGKQSMPYAYTNTGSITNSEATRTFDSIQDWTRNGVKTLTLYFYGQAGNATTVPFWVRLTDQSNKTAKVAFGAAGEDVLVLADPAWATWNIPLSSFTGITLSKIKSMTIGVGTGTGSGTLYIDDIRLYPPTTTTTVTPTMVGWWKMDNNVQDSSGAGNNGTIVGTPTYVAAGKIGASLKLNGTTDYVDCGNAASVNITDVITCSAWIKPATLANSAYQTFISKGDHAYVLAQTNGNQLQLSIYDGAWYQANSVAVTTTFNGAWHHVAGTFDGTQIRLYIDGKMAASVLRTGVIGTNTFLLSLGRNSEATGRLFNGEMDDVRVYHGVLSTSDIVKLANP